MSPRPQSFALSDLPGPQPTHRSGTGTMSAAERDRRQWRSLGMVGVAQLVERRLVVADVAGSNPVTHPYVRGPVSL